MKRSGRLRVDPEKVAAWQRRSRRRLPAMSDRRRAELPARAAVRAETLARDGGCRLAGVDGAGECWGRLTFQHVRKASQGGEFTPENGAALCWGHNERIEADADLAALARSLGLVKLAGD